MEKRTPPKSITIGLICIVFAALIGFSIYQNQVLKNQSAPALPEASTNETATTDTQIASDSISKNTSAAYDVATASADSPQSTGNIEDLEAELENREDELYALRQQLDEEMSEKEEMAEKELEYQRQYISDPSFKSSIRNSLELQYEDLFEELNLSDEQKEMALDALTTKTLDRSELSIDAATASTDEEKNSVRERNSDINETCETELQDILGSEYDAYHDHVEMLLTRSYAGRFNSTLDEDNQLTEAQEEELARIMYKEQMKAFNEMGYDPRNDMEFQSDVTSGKVDGQAATMKKIHSGTLENCKDVLSETQYELYQQYLNGKQEMTEQSELITQLSE